MDIIHSDESILVVNKPANLSVLAEGWDKHLPSLAGLLGDQFGRIWVVHRLDKITSGIIVFALDANSHRSLNLQFEKHQVEKKYHALVNGLPHWSEKTVKFPLRVDVGHKHRTRVDDRDGVHAETGFKVLERYKAFTLIEATPVTGRTHQIRVHLYALGFPILGDSLYSAPPTDLISRPALHAYSLAFTHPVSSERQSFIARYPPDFESAIQASRAGRQD